MALQSLRILTQSISGSDDASQIAGLVGCSGKFWAWSWFILSAAALAGAFWFTWLSDITV